MRLIAAVFLLLLTGCAPSSGPGPHAVLEAALDDAAAASGPAGVLVYVDGPALSMPFTGARSGADGVAINPAAAMRIASNTKTFVAAAALRLAEDGRIDLDAPLADVLPEPYPRMLSDGGYDIAGITSRMLLQHVSGLPDHGQLDVYFEQIMAEPDRVWTRQEQVALAMSHGEAVGAPGERFSYSDTGYVLMGAVIEQASGLPLAVAVRTLTGLDERGLTSTWWETLEPVPAPEPERLRQTAFGMNLADIHPSVDLYGGGGLVSSLTDLARFHRAAATGALFSDSAIATAMVTPTPQSLAAGPSGYAMGFFTREIEGETCYEHSGFWGTLAYYCPLSGVSVSAGVTDAQGFHALPAFVRDAVQAAR